ncbi:MAG: hypothetical protein ACR2RB_17320 [Gammaproteobacteria bacterium]
MSAQGPMRVRNERGGTPALAHWGMDSEYGVLRDVLLGPVETFHWMEDNARFSSIVHCVKFSHQWAGAPW